MYKGAYLWILSDSSMEELVVWAGWLIITTTLRMVSMLCRDRFSVVRPPRCPGCCMPPATPG